MDKDSELLENLDTHVIDIITRHERLEPGTATLDSTFAELGIDSLSATKLLFEFEEAFGERARRGRPENEECAPGRRGAARRPDLAGLRAAVRSGMKGVVITGIEHLRCHDAVRLGEEVHLEAVILRRIGPVGRMRGCARVGRRMVARGMIRFALVPRGEQGR